MSHGESFRCGLVVAAIAFVLYVLSPNVTNGDSYLSFPTAVSIVHSGDLTLDEFDSPLVQDHYALVETDSGVVNAFPWTVALFHVPSVVALDVLSAAGIGAGSTSVVDNDGMGLFQLINASLVAAVAAGLVAMAAHARSRGHGRSRFRSATAVGLIFALGTASWSTASRSMWQHGPSMALSAGAILVALHLDKGRPRVTTPFALGVLVGLAFTVRPTNALIVVAFGVWIACRVPRSFVPFVLGGLGVAAPWLLVNHATSRTWLPGYFSGGRIGWHSSYLEAAAANLVSPSRGLLVFSPVVVLAAVGVWLRIRERVLDGLDVVAIAVATGYWLMVSGFGETWWAGHSIGPRFMADALPFLAFLSVATSDKVVALVAASETTLRQHAILAGIAALVIWSVFVNGAAAALRATNCWNVEPVDLDVDPGRIWSWTEPQFAAGPVALIEHGPLAAVRGSQCADS